MADSADLNLDAPSDLQDIPDAAMEMIPPPEGTYPDKCVCPLRATLRPRVHVCGSSKWQGMC